jgi:hypothetical protein
MPVQLSLIRDLGITRCTVKHENAGGSVEFDIDYRPEAVTMDAFEAMLEAQTVGIYAQTIGAKVDNAGKGVDENDANAVQAAMVKLQDEIDRALTELKAKTERLARPLSLIVKWQDIAEGDRQVEPTEEFFLSLSPQLRMSYINAIIANRQRPTNNSESISLSGSTAKESLGVAPRATLSTEPPTALTVASSTSKKGRKRSA